MVEDPSENVRILDFLDEVLILDNGLVELKVLILLILILAHLISPISLGVF